MTVRLLEPTPLDGAGVPLPADAPVGSRTQIAGVAMVAVSFETDFAALLVIDSVTSPRRESLAAMQLPEVAPGQYRLTLWLPADGEYSYRYVPGGVPEADLTRAEWLTLVERGVPDARGGERITLGRGGAASVWRGPDAPVARWPAGVGVEAAGWPECPDGWGDVWVAGEPDVPESTRRRLRIHGGAHCSHWLLLHDGATWARLGIDAALAACGLLDDRLGVVLIDAIDQPHRAAQLPFPETAAAIARQAVTAARDLGAAPDPARTMVAGQSFGGLGAAGAVLTAPDVARIAFVHSGSFWFDGAWDGTAIGRAGGDGLHAKLAAETDLRGRRFRIHFGTEEGSLHATGLEFARAATASGAETDVTQHRGGHSYVWWREALLADLRAELVSD